MNNMDINEALNETNATIMDLCTNNITNCTQKVIHEYPSAWKILIMYMASGGAALLNLSVFYTVPKLKGKIKASTRYAMLNLAITDALLGFGSLILRSIYLASPEVFMENFCKLDGIFSTFLVSQSIIGLAFLNLDKFLNLLLPLKYKVWMTGKKAITVLISMWLFYVAVFTFSSLPIFAEPLLKPELVEGAFICLPNYTEDLLMTTMAIVMQQVFPSTVCIASLIGMYSIVTMRSAKLREGQNTTKINERTLVFTIFLLTCTYFLMCMPFFIFVIFWGMTTGAPFSPTMSFLSIWIGGANSAVNPLIYIPSLRSYRNHLKQAVCPKQQRKDSLKTLREFSNYSSESRL